MRKSTIGIAVVLACSVLSNAQEDAASRIGAELQEGEGQSLESMANDSTASQWSYQVAYEYRDWRDDTLSNGAPRPQGNIDMWQFRLVAPIDKKMTGWPITILPRLTLRNNEAADKSSGAGNSELFALVIAKEWDTGRWGIGPQINFPADDPKFGTTDWRYGIATAILQRAANDKMMLGLLIQQIWGKAAPEDSGDTAAPITIQPILNYSLPHTTYINIGETAFSYDWDDGEWLVPLGVRLGKLWIKESGTINLYGEYRTTVVYKDWNGSALENAYRINVSYTVPM